MNYWLIGYIGFAWVTYVLLFGTILSTASKDQPFKGKVAVVLFTLILAALVAAVWPLTYVLLNAWSLAKADKK